MRKNQNSANVIVAILVVVEFLFSLALGCEQEFAEWAV